MSDFKEGVTLFSPLLDDETFKNLESFISDVDTRNLLNDPCVNEIQECRVDSPPLETLLADVNVDDILPPPIWNAAAKLGNFESVTEPKQTVSATLTDREVENGFYAFRERCPGGYAAFHPNIMCNMAHPHDRRLDIIIIPMEHMDDRLWRLHDLLQETSVPLEEILPPNDDDDADSVAKRKRKLSNTETHLESDDAQGEKKLKCSVPVKTVTPVTVTLDDIFKLPITTWERFLTVNDQLTTHPNGRKQIINKLRTLGGPKGELDKHIKIAMDQVLDLKEVQKAKNFQTDEEGWGLIKSRFLRMEFRNVLADAMRLHRDFKDITDEVMIDHIAAVMKIPKGFVKNLRKTSAI